jgi:tRNA threonylcarbamoyl adenosine modification protein YjeE
VAARRLGELTEAELTEWGERIGREAARPLFLALRGDLGAGKSVLARAVARGAGVVAAMPSPTFNLVFEYAGARGVRVAHLDLYRLREPQEVWELGWSELGEGEQIVLVEWPERAESLLPGDRWDIWLDAPGSGASVREVRCQRVGRAGSLPAPEAAVGKPRT